MGEHQKQGGVVKLFKRQLIMFQRGMGQDGPQSHYVIAAWHWNWSITWRWLIWWWPPSSLKYPFGTFIFRTQKNMRMK